jgi:hypothetical protein
MNEMLMMQLAVTHGIFQVNTEGVTHGESLHQPATSGNCMSEPAPYSPGDNPDETLGSLLYLIAFHQAYHVGQLGLCRRLAGKSGGVN